MMKEKAGPIQVHLRTDISNGDGETVWKSGGREVGTYENDVLVPMEGDELNGLFTKTEDYVDHCIKMKAQCFTSPEKDEDGNYIVQAQSDY